MSRGSGSNKSLGIHTVREEGEELALNVKAVMMHNCYLVGTS